MRVLVVSGIWPPDVGGPASHAPDVAAFLRGRGHDVEAVVTADTPPPPEQYPVRFVSRRLPRGVRHVVALALVLRRARRVDVVYTTGMFGRSAVGAVLARRPYVVKLTGDPAFERLRWRGVVDGDVEAFQHGGGGLQGAALRALRGFTLRRAAFVFCPSAYLHELALGWGVAPDRVAVLPNPAPVFRSATSREELRAQFGFAGTALAFAGRLTAQKELPSLLDAVARVGGVTLALAGDGPERSALERGIADRGLDGRVRLLGPLPRERVLELFHAADAAVLSSAWENFPHTVVEALAAGTPVLSTAVGGVAEVVTDGVNGLLVPAGDADALAEAIRRFAGDEELRNRLRAAAASSVRAYAAETVFGELEAMLRRAAA